jgi:CheY-like chemotaxis protein
VLNIAINARDAMRDGGCIEIVTDNFTQGREDAKGDLAPGRYVRIAISDDGEGIPEDVLPHVFEPFFTTKEPGRGSGLGLSMVYGFVQQSGGRIDVKSKVGHGTTVTMYLPGVVLPAAERRMLQAVPAHTVLVVEDDPAVVEDALRRLRDDGYRVFSALDADEAMRVVAAESVDVVLIDAVLAHGMSGVDLAERFHERHAPLQTVLMAGRALAEAERARAAAIGAPVLRKPVDVHELSWRVASALAYGQRGSNEPSAPEPPSLH